MNIYDLAQKAGVSISTASKALNNRHDVNEATRARVLKLAERLRYTPSRMARGLAKSRSENIGLIALRRHGFPFFTNPFYSHVLAGMESEVAARDYNLLLSVVEDKGGGTELPKKVREKNVDGLILVGWMPPAFLTELGRSKLPMVTVDYEAPGLKALALLLDNEGGMAQAVDRMAAAGHRRIGFVGGQLSEASFRERHGGFLKAMKAHGMAPGPELVAPEGRELGLEEFRAYLVRKDRPRAVVAANDDHALKLLAQAQGLGLKVPQDLALSGFDDIDYAASSQPRLSTLRVNKQALGALAVKRLVEMIEGGIFAAKAERLPVEWVQRKSI